MQTLNEQFIRISSRLPLPKEVELGQDLVMTIEGQAFVLCCVKQEVFDKQDGTFDKVSILKSTAE